MFYQHRFDYEGAMLKNQRLQVVKAEVFFVSSYTPLYELYCLNVPFAPYPSRTHFTKGGSLSLLKNYAEPYTLN